jgi:hypothetical protein
MQPRIYTYKITFEEVPYYYYGSKKEKYYNQPYMGSPKTHKWCWELYTPKKQILELFEFSDNGYEECRRVEDRLIKPVLNDPWCLNEGCSGFYSLNILRSAGKMMGEKCRDLNIGIFLLSSDEKSKIALKGGNKTKELNVGIFNLTKEQRREYSKKGVKSCKEKQVGVYGMTSEQKSEYGKKGGTKNYKNKTGIFSLSKEEVIENAKNAAKALHSQRWMCLETQHITNAASLTKYQRNRGIDTTKRIRVG